MKNKQAIATQEEIKTAFRSAKEKGIAQDHFVVSLRMQYERTGTLTQMQFEALKNAKPARKSRQKFKNAVKTDDYALDEFDEMER